MFNKITWYIKLFSCLDFNHKSQFQGNWHYMSNGYKFCLLLATKRHFRHYQLFLVGCILPNRGCWNIQDVSLNYYYLLLDFHGIKTSSFIPIPKFFNKGTFEHNTQNKVKSCVWCYGVSKCNNWSQIVREGCRGGRGGGKSISMTFRFLNWTEKY